MNKWIAKGRLAKNPEIRYTQSGTAVASFTLACDRRKRKDAPPDAPTADFINCVAWDKLAQTIQFQSTLPAWGATARRRFISSRF